jgi:uncharacterized protein (TIGR04255 family)
VRPFKTPLFRVTTEVNLPFVQVGEFRGRSLLERLKKVLGAEPAIQQFPVLFVPPEQATEEQKQLTPPIYSFSSTDGDRLVATGHRVITASLGKWPGYDAYKAFVQEVLSIYFELSYEPQIQRHSLGFYNRIPVADVTELREILKTSADLDDGISLFEFVRQHAHSTEAGSVLTQMIVLPGDATTPEPFLAVNNIIRSEECAGSYTGLAQILEWLDKAHDIGKSLLWNSLSNTAKESWKANAG